jgi:hypothetical protein
MHLAVCTCISDESSLDYYPLVDLWNEMISKTIPSDLSEDFALPSFSAPAVLKNS